MFFREDFTVHKKLMHPPLAITHEIVTTNDESVQIPLMMSRYNAKGFLLRFTHPPPISAISTMYNASGILLSLNLILWQSRQAALHNFIAKQSRIKAQLPLNAK